MVYLYSKRITPANFRPLIRQTVRGRVKEEDSKIEGRDVYVIEIREFHEDADDVKGTPHVSIMDRKKLTDIKGNQKSVWLPVTICEEILKYLLKCKVATSSTSSSEASGEDSISSSPVPPTSTKQIFDVSKLEPCVFTCKESARQVTLDVIGEEGSRRLRSYMKVPVKALATADDDQEVVELRNELIPKLTKFLADVIIRYGDIKGQLNVPSLYSPSGERRFFFDLRPTRYGKRLYLSQVTEFHRNAIAVPLDSLLAFRDRINKAIDSLHIEEGVAAATKASMMPSGNHDSKVDKPVKAILKKRGHQRRTESKLNESGDKPSPTVELNSSQESTGDGEVENEVLKN